MKNAFALRSFFAFVGLATGCVSMAANAASPRSYTVDDMLKLESIGNVSISDDGRTLIFDRYGPYGDQAAFDRGYIPGETRSKIYVANLTGTAEPRQLFLQASDRGYAHASLSPDGRSILYTETGRDTYSLGVASLAKGTARRLNFAADNGFVLASYWFAGDRFVLPALDERDLSRFNLGLRRPQGLLAGKWLDAFNGQASTASVIGSGKFVSTERRDDSIVIGDASDGSSFVLASGAYGSQVPAPDGRLVATLRETALQINAEKRVDLRANRGRTRALVVFAPRPNAAPVEPCRECDVLVGSLVWRVDGARLAFFARRAGEDWSAGQFRIFDARSRSASPVPLGALRPKFDQGWEEVSVGAAWLDGRLVIRAGVPDARTGEIKRADWYLNDGGRLRNLTSSFPAEPGRLAGLASDGLLLVHDGELWKVTASGERTNLTAAVAEKVEPWRKPTPFGEPPLENVQPSSHLTVSVAASAGEVARLLLIDTRDGRTTSFAAPSPDSKFVAVSSAGRRAAVLDRSGNVTRLLLLSAEGSPREIVTLNEHLRGVVGGTPVRIDHKGPKGDDRISWMLLPPGREPNTSVPTVVNVYPGAVGRKTFSRAKLDEVHALNDHILAAQGYAVLYPSLPVDQEKVPRDTLEGLPEEVFAAVDAAVAKGYAASDRLAIQGHSFGAYATGGLIGVTDRFKSAIVMAGTFNLLSAYGSFDVRQRLEHPIQGLDLFFVHAMESGQNGLGAPPWDDPQRYLRNSPLLHVKSIKTPIMLITGDLDFVPTTQTEEFFTALTRLNKDAVMVRYWGEEHVLSSPANIRDMWKRIFEWYGKTL